MALTLKAKYSDIILRPRIAEKASFVAESNVYTFEVAKNATKKQVAEAIKIFYEITPVKVNMVKNPAKKILVRGEKGITAGVKKAYVYLKEGDKIE
jgi:large subunit ribosomal protein L23